MNRRNFLGAMLAACAAPAVVRAGSLMRINPAIVVPDTISVWEGPIVIKQFSTDLGLQCEEALGARVQLIREMVQWRAICIEGNDRWLKLK